MGRENDAQRDAENGRGSGPSPEEIERRRQQQEAAKGSRPPGESGRGGQRHETAIPQGTRQGRWTR